MRTRLPTAVAALSVGVVLAAPMTAFSQSAAGRGGAWRAPRTEWGHPDLQGNWSNATLTPIERPPGRAAVLTPEQVAEIEGGVRNLIETASQPGDPNRSAPPAGGDTFDIPPSVLTGSFVAASGGTGGYDIVYIDSGEKVAVVNGEPRSSLITFPANGRVPPITAEAQRRRAEASAPLRQFGQYDHPELRSLGDRCILSFGSNAGPPMLPNGFYNNNYTIVQTADQVMILTEMVHDVRIIKLGEGPRLPPEIRPWFGDSWGRWEGETLVVETTNIHPLQRYNNNPSDNLKVIERFTRVDPETILYEFTVEDPTVYTEVWGGQVPMKKLDGRVYEYACHEGNYALHNILSGARYQERQREQDQTDGTR